jgi:hypothetical protein
MMLGHVVAAGLIAGLATGIGSAAYAAADLNGVWVVTGYSPAIKTTDGKTPPLLPEAASTYEKRKAQRAKGDVSYDLVEMQCAPPGMPRVMTIPYAFELVENPSNVIFLFEFNRAYRRVDVNGPSRAADDLQWQGRSVGHWDSNTLVVETNKIDATLLDAAGMPHSDALKITERYSLTKNGKLENRMRFDDPKTFREPWETTVTYRKLSSKIGEDVCLDRLKDTPAIQNQHYLTYPK